MATKKVAKPAPKKAVKEKAPTKEQAPKVEAVPLDDVKLGKQDREHLVTLCEDYLAASATISSFEKDKKALAAEIKEETNRLNLPPSVFTDTFKLTVSKGERKTLQAHVLLSLGVTNAVIEKATKITPTETLRVTAPSEGGEGEGD